VDPGEKEAILEAGGYQALQEGEKADSWLQTAEEKGHSDMAIDAGDGLPQLQETFMHRVSAIVHCTAVIQYNHNRNRIPLYYLFQEINHLVPITICIHPLMYGKLCREQVCDVCIVV
jgi:hypothetical protein